MHEEPASFDAAVAAATQEPLVQALVLAGTQARIHVAAGIKAWRTSLTQQ